jgi:hypothetical protein
LGQFIERTFAHELDQHLDQLAYHYGASQNDAKKREYPALRLPNAPSASTAQ